MKTTRLHCALVSALLAIPAHAQMIPSSDATAASLGGDMALGVDERPRFESKRLPGNFSDQNATTATCDLPADQNMIVSLDPATLGTRAPSAACKPDDGLFRSPSPFKRLLVSASGVRGSIPSGQLEQGLAEASAAYGSANEGKTGDCDTLNRAVIQKIGQDRSKVLEVVSDEIRANPGCACEIVKAAVKATEADADTVVAIVEAAITANPECMRIVSQCAIAANPESVSAVQALLAKLDPNSGREGYSSKGSKSGKEMIEPAKAPPPFDPLDRIYFPEPPPIIVPPPVTCVD